MKFEALIAALKQEIESNKLGLIADLIAHITSQGDEDLDLYLFLSKASETEYELLIEVIKAVKEEGFYLFNDLRQLCESE
ncbi:hypothetical protein L1D35_20245 [Vibrio harveyi]|uniref:hypothetical protein n=1 Tax=Vibrio harveyi TaxID=669 RepID=UPI001EFCFE1E|nr:hypothetical protein [Vibrio harveyi]MCG9589940.1 hypothetical protein [Vibrio harveyi]MCG9670343.1 hypothetical protein [Vibrio harveyi]